MSSTFSNASMEVSEEARLESAFLHRGWQGGIEFKVTWELVLDRKDDTHWVRQRLNISREQADSLHKVLGHMLSTDVTDITDVLQWFVRDGEVKAESEPVG